MYQPMLALKKCHKLTSASSTARVGSVYFAEGRKDSVLDLSQHPCLKELFLVQTYNKKTIFNAQDLFLEKAHFKLSPQAITCGLECMNIKHLVIFIGNFAPVSCSLLPRSLETLEMRCCLNVCANDLPFPNLSVLKVFLVNRPDNLLPLIFPKLLHLQMEKSYDITKCPLPTNLQTLAIMESCGVEPYVFPYLFPTSLQHLQVSSFKGVHSILPVFIKSFVVRTKKSPGFGAETLKRFAIFQQCYATLHTLEVRFDEINQIMPNWSRWFSKTLRHLSMDRCPCIADFVNLTALRLYSANVSEMCDLSQRLVFLEIAHVSMLQKGWFPQTLRYLYLTNYNRYNWYIDPEVFPANLVALSMPSFKQPLPSDFQFPSALVYLHLPKYTFQQPDTSRYVRDEKPTMTFDQFVQCQ